MKSAGVPTVFIIDDDRGMRQSIQDLVESVGLRAESFATGGEFLKRKRTNDPSCLVLDVRLPQMSGLDFQRRLAEIGMQIPIIFVTAHGDVPMSVRALKSGAVEFLTKPFRDQDLLDAIQQALQRDRAAQGQQAEIHDLQERYRRIDCTGAAGYGSRRVRNAQQADCLRNRSERSHSKNPPRQCHAQDAGWIGS